MIPYILAAVGGYLIGQSQKKDMPQMAEGGQMKEFKKAKSIIFPTKSEAIKRSGMLKTYYGNSARDFKVIKNGNGWAVSFEYVPNDVLGEMDGMMADGGMMAKGGYIIKRKDDDEYVEYDDSISRNGGYGITKNKPRLVFKTKKDAEDTISKNNLEFRLMSELEVVKMAEGGKLKRYEIREGKVIYTSAKTFSDFKKEQKQNYSSIRNSMARESAMMSDWKIIESIMSKRGDGGGGMMADGGVLAHGLREDDKIYVERGNLAGIKNDKTDEKFIVDISTGSREKLKD
jgi:hypothetical protein